MSFFFSPVKHKPLPTVRIKTLSVHRKRERSRRRERDVARTACCRVILSTPIENVLRVRDFYRIRTAQTITWTIDKDGVTHEKPARLICLLIIICFWRLRTFLRACRPRPFSVLTLSGFPYTLFTRPSTHSTTCKTRLQDVFSVLIFTYINIF